VTVQEAIKALESSGWKITHSEGIFRQFKHDSLPGAVTLSGKLELSIPKAVLRSLLRHAQIEEGS